MLPNARNLARWRTELVGSGAETGQATQQVMAEPRLEPRVIKAQPFALSPTTLNVGWWGRLRGAGRPPDWCV